VLSNAAQRAPGRPRATRFPVNWLDSLAEDDSAAIQGRRHMRASATTPSRPLGALLRLQAIAWPSAPHCDLLGGCWWGSARARGIREERVLWAAHGAGVLASFPVEGVAARVQGIDLGGRQTKRGQPGTANARGHLFSAVAHTSFLHLASLKPFRCRQSERSPSAQAGEGLEMGWGHAYVELRRRERDRADPSSGPAPCRSGACVASCPGARVGTTEGV